MILLSKNYKFVVLLFFGLLLNGELLASQTYWLSDIPPTKEILKKMRSSHDGFVQRSRKDGTSKRLWLRSGEDPVNSSYVKESTASLILLDAKKNLQTVTFSNQDYAEAKFKMSDEGFYNLFMINNFVEDGTMHSITAKKETLNHSCREGHDDVKEKMPPNLYDAAPIDIVRDRMPRERFHTHVTSGDLVSYQVLQNGHPLQDALVTFVTQKGWKKTLKTDKNGYVTFEMIRDYYPIWHEFKRRTRENFLVIVEYTKAQKGILNDKLYDTVKYKATSSGSYYPSTRDYQSYLYGLLIGLFGFFVTFLSMYFYRRKGASNYQEPSLD
ncbi:MAG: DUF4198 domain-containing protein [Gammaproteobacteria bacterium]|nr:DUF4198 domain-containing protein [Gammaproteobacteria bacterium]